MRKVIYVGLAVKLIKETKKIWYMLITRARRCVSWSSPNRIATSVMGLLENYYREDILLDVYRYGLLEEEVYDIVDVEQTNRFAVMGEYGNVIAHNCLGLQYGMRQESLSLKLTADTGRYVSVSEAEQLMKLHEKLFRTFWNWVENQYKFYQRNGFLTLWDGWSLLPDNDNSLSVKNVPVQGTGAVIMREACKLYQARGGKVIAPLHDAVYAVAPSEHAEYWKDTLSECMQQAVEKVLGDVEIRQDIDIHHSDEDWVEGKGKKYYEQLKKYLEHIDTDEDLYKKIVSEIYGNFE